MCSELSELAGIIRDCSKCRLGEVRGKAVPGEGAGDARVFFVGEAPGREEDLSGRPFVGQAGGLLDGFLERAGLVRGEVFITSVIKCRPPENRNPRSDELGACLPFTWRQLELVKPELVVVLGGVALKALLGLDGPLRSLHGRVLDRKGYSWFVSYHPAAPLHQPGLRKVFLRDAERLKNSLSTEQKKLEF